MIAAISSHAFDAFFAWAPWVVGIFIYFCFWLAKRHERSAPVAVATRATYACASCGRRGTLDQMIVQHHGGAVGYQCASCASAQAIAQ